MSTLKRNIFFTFITQFPTQFLGIITGIFITRLLGPDGRGIYAIFLADVDLFVTIFGLSINNAIIYHFAHGKIDKGKIYGIALIIISVATLLVLMTTGVILLSRFEEYLFPKNNINVLMMLWFIVTIIVSLLSNVFNGIFQGYKEFDIVNKVALSNSLLNIIIFGLVFLYHKVLHQEVGVEFILVLSLVVLMLNLGLWYLFLVKKHPELKPDFTVTFRNEILTVLKFLGVGHLSNIINFLNYRFSLWIIAIYLNPAEVGYYGLAVGISGMLNLVTMPVSVVLMPYLATEDYETRRKMFRQYSRVNFTILLLLGIAGFIIAPWIIPFVYGKEFLPSVLIFQICLIGAVFSSQNKIWGMYNMSNNKQSVNLYATIIGIIFTVFFSFILIPSFGLIGATVGSIVTYICMFVFLYVNFSIENKLYFINVFVINASDVKNIKMLYERKRRGNKVL